MAKFRNVSGQVLTVGPVQVPVNGIIELTERDALKFQGKLVPVGGEVLTETPVSDVVVEKETINEEEKPKKKTTRKSSSKKK